MPNGTRHEIESAKQLDDAEQRDDQRAEVERPPGRRQPQRERDHELAETQRQPLPPGQPGERVLALAAGEEVVGVARVVREQAPELVAGEVARVGVDPVARPALRR